MSGEPERIDGDDEKCSEEIEWGEGDPWMLFVMNPILSIVFAAIIVHSLLYINLAAFSVIDAALAVLVFTAVTHPVTN